MAMLGAVLLLLTLSAAYYLYTPIPVNIQEPWRLMMLDASLRTIRHVESMSKWLGLISVNTTLLNHLVPTDTNARPGLKFSDITLAGVPVRVYEPLGGGEGHLRRAVMFFHGGGWAIGSAKSGAFNDLCQTMSYELNAVVVSVDYRLYPVVFPEPYLDCLAVAKHLLSHEVLAQYSIDPDRVGVAGDSAGGNLAAAVAQEISQDDTVTVKFRLQALVYPALQALDFNTPSYLDSHNVPPAYRSAMIKFWLQYLGAGVSKQQAAMKNHHSAADKVPPEMWARVDWASLLPAKFKKNHKTVRVQKSSLLKEVPALLDVRASPLLASSEVLAKTPLAYILTAEHDILRDDGLMYARRLQDAGVTVTSEYLEDGFHGCLSFVKGPLSFDVGKRAEKSYITWLQNNL
ncbi:neutral cholesterol ester hydrolase 1-like [Synchiropus splendidus]|uniref:neutral cholesterol ester hydrolase 1-like n=1 Tax=Synchiropus splendidus TaxID=270530 RepID=UPI00237E146F|nr:neutral cholesterol ester hydrolase 1-like [Synchiropus splendidus]